MFCAAGASEGNRQSAMDTADNFETYKKWIHSTYGEQSKAKTITWAKYLRIHKVLSGRSIGERPKFKFWVKSKGFCFVRCYPLSGRPSEISGLVIAQPNKKMSVEGRYKRVAVVEEFFDIIHGVHIGVGGKNGKHAGQKRTYKAIMESYACLPREAVTHFLMSCEPCCARMRLSLPASIPLCMNESLDSSISSLTSPDRCSSTESSIDVEYLSKMSVAEENGVAPEELTVVDDNVTLQSPMKSEKVDPSSLDDGDEIDVGVKADLSTDVDTKHELSEAKSEINNVNEERFCGNVNDKKSLLDDKMIKAIPHISSPLKRSADMTHIPSPKSSKKGSDDGDDDDDDGDDDDTLSISPTEVDPERLKAFNMFCRLFVDENLDRLIPISKQPKEKLQSILDACNRQFPEFQERSRKRVRTYLKSCRRMRRARNMNGLESIRPTPPHLTSPVAESLLSQACENEMENSKRIKMGLDPLPATPISRRVMSQTSASSSLPPPNHVSAAIPGTLPSLVQAGNINQTSAQPIAAHRMLPDWRFQPNAPFRHDLTPFFGNGFFRPHFPGLHAPVPTAALQGSQATANPLSLQPSPAVGVTADLNVMKKQTTPASSTPNKGSSGAVLSASEKATIRQLISGYRESATFLYRSADELELLIAHSG